MLSNSGKRWQIYDAIHISGSSKWPIFDGEGSSNVSQGYRSDNLIDYSGYYNDIIRRNYPLIVMGGEFDMQDGIAGQYLWMKELLNVSKQFWNQTKSIYYFQSESSNDTIVGGYWIHENNFTLVTVPKSGHFVPANFYEASKLYIDDFVSNNTLKCHSGNCSPAESMCSAMNNCNGKGRCVNG